MLSELSQRASELLDWDSQVLIDAEAHSEIDTPEYHEFYGMCLKLYASGELPIELEVLLEAHAEHVAENER